MKMLITQEEFDSYKSRQPVPLECEHCKQIFYKNKHRIQGDLSQNKPVKFCGPKCQNENKKQNSQVLLKCDYCFQQFIKLKSDITKHNFCSHKCSGFYFGKLRNNKKEITCLNCKKIFFRNPCNIVNNNQFCSRKCHAIYSGFSNKEIVLCNECKSSIIRSINRNKNYKYHFCNNSCKAKFANRTYNRAARFGKNKSKGETILRDMILKDFPKLIIKENDRLTIPGGLEIDLFLPDLKIAIELNGPCHYIPIFGAEALEKTKNKDGFKLQFLQKSKIKFFIVNIMVPDRALNATLLQSYETIKPIIENSINANNQTKIGTPTGIAA